MFGVVGQPGGRKKGKKIFGGADAELSNAVAALEEWADRWLSSLRAHFRRPMLFEAGAFDPRQCWIPLNDEQITPIQTQHGLSFLRGPMRAPRAGC